MLPLWILSLGLIFLTDQVSAQERPQAPVFGTGTGLVLVDFVVTDKGDKPVGGLSATDFVVKEDGKERPIMSFLAFGGIAAPASQSSTTTEPEPTATSIPTARDAVTVLLVDDGLLTPGQGERLRPALKTLLSRMGEISGGIAIVAPASKVFEARILPEGAADLEAAVDQITMVPAGMNGSEGRRYRYAIYDVMVDALKWLAGKPGRHSLVLVSQGFPHIRDDSERSKVVTASLRANAPIHFLDVRGTEGISGYRDASGLAGFGGVARQPGVLESSIRAEGARALADDTGGLTIRNGNDLNNGLGRVLDGMKTYYLLGYDPPTHQKPGFRKISVEVRTKGLRILARQGYFDEVTAGR